MANKLNATQNTSTPTRLGNKALKTMLRVIFGVLLICASLFGLLYWIIEESATYLILAIVLFLGEIVHLALGI